MKATSRLLIKIKGLRTTFRVGIIPGDGVGQEVVPWGQKLLEAVSKNTPLTFELVPLEAGFGTFKKTGKSVPDDTMKGLKSCDAALFGAAATPVSPPVGYIPPIVDIRQRCNLFAAVRPLVSVPLDKKPARPNVDMLVIRENTECLYVQKERWAMDSNLGGKVAIAERYISEKASRRIARLAFTVARQRRSVKSRPPHVTIVHKANILPVTDGLFLECCKDVAKEFADIPFDDQLLDSFMYKVTANPAQYDVVVAPNTWGNVISNAIAPMVGGLGMVAGINQGGNLLVAEPVHGTPKHLEGKGIANPIATMRAAAMIVQRLAPTFDVEYYFENAIKQVLMEGKILTPDLGGHSTTEEVGKLMMTRFVALLQLGTEQEGVFRDG